MRYPWWRFEPHPEWVDPHWSKDNYEQPYAAGIPGEVRVIFIPPAWNPPKVTNLEPALLIAPSTSTPPPETNTMLGAVTPDSAGAWPAPLTPTFADWILVLEENR